MTYKRYSKTVLGEPRAYQIRVKGHLGCQWTEWFDELTITLEENGDTLLTGLVVVQAALYGLLKKVRDLGMLLLSVNLIKTSQTKTSAIKQVMNDQVKANLEKAYENTT